MSAPPLLQVACPGVAQQQPEDYLVLAGGPGAECPPASLWGIGLAELIPLGVGSKPGQPGHPSAAARVLRG